MARRLSRFSIAALTVALIGSSCAPKGSVERGERPGASEVKLIPFLRTQVLGSGRGFNQRSGKSDLPDRLNWDIDGDGIPNLADQYPDDPDRKGEDLDGDGIPDFIQFRNVSPRLAWLQKAFHDRFGVYVIQDGASFTEEELEEIYRSLEQGPLAAFGKLEFFSVLIKRKGDVGAGNLFGEHDRFWRVITLYEGSPEDLRITFLHEVFHAISIQYPADLEAFYRQAGWEISRSGTSATYRYRGGLSFGDYEIENEMERIVQAVSGEDFPSDYSKLGPLEMFSECGAATLLSLEGERGPFLMDSFTKSPSYRWFLAYFDRVRKNRN